MRNKNNADLLNLTSVVIGDGNKISNSLITAKSNTTLQPNHVELSEDLMNQIINRLSIKPTVKHQCHSCGATLELDSDKHIFICKYCGSVYAVGTQMINDMGQG